MSNSNSTPRPVPGATVSLAVYDSEEKKMVVFQGVLEVVDDYYVLQNPNILTPTGPQMYTGVVVLGRINEVTKMTMKNSVLESEKIVRPQTATPAPAPVSSEAPSSFSVSDRCDRCGARAYVRAAVPISDDETTELLFCGHHGRKHLPALRQNSNVTVTDETERLYAEVSADD